jgi:hypothetical protein
MHALTEAGWQDAGRLHSRTHPTKKQIFVSPAAAEMYSKTQLRDMVETSAPAPLRVVKNPPGGGL